MRRLLTIVAIVSALGATTAGAATPPSCSALEKAQYAKTLTAFAKQMPAARRAYYKHHHGTAQRKRFVAAQNRKLAGLRAAAGCIVAVTTPPAPPAPTTPPASTPPAAPTPAPANPPAPDPTPVWKPTALHISDNVDSRVADALRLSISAGDAYFRRLGAPDTWRYDFWADNNPTVLAALWPTLGTGNTAYTANLAFVTLGVTAVADHDQVLYRTFAPGLSAPTPSSIPAHELFHTVQNALLGSYQTTSGATNEIPPGGPAWLREGSAEFIGELAILDAGLLPPSLTSLSAFHPGTAYIANHTYAGVPLEALAPQSALTQSSTSRAVGQLGWLAVEEMVYHLHIEPAAFVDYNRRVGQGTAWETAFHEAFGRSIDEFYAEFAAVRATWWNISGFPPDPGH